jgi:hypothetical protein
VTRSAPALALCWVLVVACSKSERQASPPVFGGQGAVVSKERPLADDDAPYVSGDPCGRPRPPADAAMLDDFEDGDAKIFKVFQREGWWYAATDGTEGATLRPPSGDFAAERLSASEATKDNLFAAHFVAEGQKDWGATWGTTLRWVDKGVRCPFDASAFGGIKLRVRGRGTVRIGFSMPETIPPEFGGKCKQGCYDSHSKTLFLTDAWTEYSIAWQQLQQGGWGTDVRFDPARLLDLGFKADAKNLPVDFWVDDIGFLPKTASVAK